TLLAAAIHQASPRKNGPFIIVDCASIPGALFESELFGHKKGAFTGAYETHQGALQAAHGGTVFLDEIGELPLSMQPKLLRVMETRSVKPVGETYAMNLEFRIIAA